MITPKQDRDIDFSDMDMLASYRVEDMPPQEREALVDEIVAAASLVPQQPRMTSFFKMHSMTAAPVAALVVVAVLGYSIGFGLTRQTAFSRNASAQQVSSTEAEYFNQMVFGSKSWKEVCL
ncbi:MAG: hypothetical protein WC464_00445 [Bdellovibrionales bacterium]